MKKRKENSKYNINFKYFKYKMKKISLSKSFQNIKNKLFQENQSSLFILLLIFNYFINQQLFLLSINIDIIYNLFSMNRNENLINE